MFQNKNFKRNATYAIAEVAEVALCASNCALPTSGIFKQAIKFDLFFLAIFQSFSDLKVVFLVN